MRIILKGGVWKNTEDEILKVAVMKYGKNQWSRISSLLTRKTPKQCKARWYEWLDPSIKKTEWSKEEDEKLLHLAKLMPTQWRTIAPIVERTPAQCLERYQRLLDDAEREITDGSSESLKNPYDVSAGQPDNSSRRLRPGEIDPDPETKPARPDPVDMDEDEKEMLSEARARLANTQGKKAKRKARERQLEESRRLAALQKRRELKAAGLISGNAHHRATSSSSQDNYNRDIPFQRLPQPGFHDTSQELSRKSGRTFAQLMLSQVEGKRKAEREAQMRIKDAKRRKHNITEAHAAGLKSGIPCFVPARGGTANDKGFNNENKIFETEMSTKRAPLVLPSPQVSVLEIEQLTKLGATQVPFDADSDMISNYSATPYMPTRTPCVPLADLVREQARNHAISNSLQTPLLGEQDHSSTHRFSSNSISSASVAGTPATNFTSGFSVCGTPVPLRDGMGINTPSCSSNIEETQIERGLRERDARKTLLASLQSLPAPQNDYQIVLPSDNANGNAIFTDKSKSAQEAINESRREDQSDIERQNSEKHRRLVAEKLEKRSQVLVRGLPRPNRIPSLNCLIKEVPKAMKDDPALMEAHSLIMSQLIELIQEDNEAYPELQYKVPPPRPNIEEKEDDGYINIEWIRRARKEINLYRENSFENKAAYEAQINKDIENHLQYTTNIYNPRTGMLLESEDSPSMFMAEKFSGLSNFVLEASSRAGRIEKKISVKYGGYEKRATVAAKRLTEFYTELRTAAADYESINLLREKELIAIPARIKGLRDHLTLQKQEEQKLQTLYRDLVEQQNSLTV